MTDKHTDETQRDEHAIISGVAGKKVFNIDSDGNVLNFSGVTVYQGDVPWASLGTTTLGATADVTSNSGVTVYQGEAPWTSEATVTIGSQATVSIYGSQGEVFGQDASTLTMQTIEYEHHEIHSGSHYFLTGYNTLDNTNVHDYTIKTPDTGKWAHLLFEIETSDATTINVYEGASAVSGASLSLFTPINNNRNSANTSDLTIWSLPSIAGVGSQIISHKWPNKTQGSLNRDHELVLKQNETYLWRFTSGANANIINFDVTWYEHTDKV
jgi:hypothetical protein